MNKNVIVSAVIAAVIAVSLMRVLSPAVKPVEAPQVSSVAGSAVLDRIKKSGTVRCGAVAWPPFYELDPNTKELKGFYKDITDAVMSLTGWKVQYIDVVAGNEVQDLNNGKVDLICGAGPWYLNSLKEVDYTRPLAYAAAYIWTRDDEMRFPAPETLNRSDIKFIGVDGDVSVDLAQRFFPLAQTQTMPGTTDPASMLLNVATRKADAVVTDPITVALYNKSNDVKLKSLFPDHPIAVYGMEFSMKKGEAELLQTINGYSDMALNMNMIDPILKKYDPTGTVFFLPAHDYQTPMAPHDADAK